MAGAVKDNSIMQKVVKARLLETILVLKTISAMLPFDISVYITVILRLLPSEKKVISGLWS